MNGTPLEVKVWGDFACFTRPEFGTERVSYEVMTPSAARGVLEAIFWKPEFSWQIKEIAVLPPVKRDLNGKPLEPNQHVMPFRHTSILRNEINNVQSDRSARGGASYYADDPKNRAQRHTLALRDTAYIIRADVALRPHAVVSGAHPAKYRDQFRRRVKRGQCHHQPYLGTREFSAFFSETDDETPVQVNTHLGRILFDLDFQKVAEGKLEYLSHDASGPKHVKGQALPKFFIAELEQGVLYVPQALYGVAS